MKYAHQHKILHGDLKPSNFLYKSDSNHQIKIIGFGLTMDLEIDRVNITYQEKSYVTPYYSPPELNTGVFDFRCDI